MAIQFDRANSTQNLNTSTNKPNLRPSGQQTSDTSQVRKQADSVSLSQSARALQALGQQDNQTQGIDQARVEQLKQAIDDGSYQVDSQRVANKMIEFDRQF